MRYSATDKTEIIQLVEQSHWPARRTLEKLGVPRSSFYRWYDRYQRGGPEALAERPSRPDRVWNRIPEAIRDQIVELALDQPELSPRELAVHQVHPSRYDRRPHAPSCASTQVSPISAPNKTGRRVDPAAVLHLRAHDVLC